MNRGKKMQDLSWQEKGSCVGHPDPDLWHYENARYSDEQQLEMWRSVEAITICRTCPVKNECLQEGLQPENIEYWEGAGAIWGGLLLSERYKLARSRENRRILTAERRHRRNVNAKLGKIA